MSLVEQGQLPADKRASADLDSTLVEGECIMFDPWEVDPDASPHQNTAIIQSDTWFTRGEMR